VNISPLAGHVAPAGTALDVSKLITAYYSDAPDPSIAAQRVAFGTSGHRGTSFDRTFNEQHVLAISEAVCRYRRLKKIDGPLFLGIDTHALSVPACATALEVFAAHGVDVMLAEHDEFTPTPAISHAIVCYNKGRSVGFADGVVLTPSHNPPDNGGYKYNPPSGGPAETDVTSWIEKEANDLLDRSLDRVTRMSHELALRASSTHRHDYISAYVKDLSNVVDLELVRGARLRLGVDPLGGAGVRYWPRIAEQYQLDLTIVSDVVDPTFGFMPLDWDGRIRTDPSSIYAMRRLIGLKDTFDVAFACDADHDRHGIVTPGAGLMPPNHYLATMIQHLFTHRSGWPASAGVGKTVVSSSMIDRVTAGLRRKLFEVPVGFKWFVEGLVAGSIGFCGEESAGATCVRRNGTVWTTDKDGIVAALLAAEITASAGTDPGEVYAALAGEFGNPASGRSDAAATVEQKRRLGALEPENVHCTELAGEPVVSIINKAPGNGAPIGGVKVSSASGWFAARPSGTEELYKIYAESFRGEEALSHIMTEAQVIVDAALAGS
jgi:phosphoglucomutase